jgi:photosystem II stability/assembly factor-like uncharacterized protein
MRELPRHSMLSSFKARIWVGWQERTAPFCTHPTAGLTGRFRGLAFSDSLNGWATAVRATHQDWLGEDDDWTASIFHTSDGGQNWTRQILPDNASFLGRIDFVDSRTGWAAGAKRLEQEDTRIGHAGVVYSTKDGGKSWQDVESGIPTDLRGLFFFDREKGWMAGDQGIIVKTESILY